MSKKEHAEFVKQLLLNAYLNKNGARERFLNAYGQMVEREAENIFEGLLTEAERVAVIKNFYLWVFGQYDSLPSNWQYFDEVLMKKARAFFSDFLARYRKFTKSS